MNKGANLVVENLVKQIAELSKEKSIYYALAVEKEQENKKLKEELNKLQKENKELDKRDEENNVEIID